MTTSKQKTLLRTGLRDRGPLAWYGDRGPLDRFEIRLRVIPPFPNVTGR